MTNNSTLAGLTITSTGPNAATGVRMFGVSGVTIAGNTISASGGNNTATAVALLSSSATLSNNNLSAVISLPGPISRTTALIANAGTYTVSGNTFYVSGGDITRALNLVGNPTFNAGSTGNTLASGGCFAPGAVTGTIGLAGGATCP
jgi:hypothetical protein